MVKMLPKGITAVCLLLSVLSTILIGITMISATKSNFVVEALPWSLGTFNSDSVNYDVYVGTYELVLKFRVNNDDNKETLKYTETSCTASFCDKCRTSNEAALGLVGLFFFVSLPPLLVNYMKFSARENTSIMRWTGLISVVLGILSGLSSMYFAARCRKSVEDDNDTIGLVWTYGPAFGLIAIATVLKFLEVLFEIFNKNNLSSLDPKVTSSTLNSSADTVPDVFRTPPSPMPWTP